MSIFRNKNNIYKNQHGFTLIELLVVVAIMAVIAGITSDLFVSILKGANKANVMNEIKQNGNYVLDIMERNIRNAKTITKINDRTIVLQDNTGKYIQFRIIPPNTTSTPKENGKITMATSILEADLSINEKDLTNTNLVSGASVQDGLFTVVSPTPPEQNPSYVSISFTVLQAENAPSRQDYKIGGNGLVFQTTVSLRTY